MFPHFAQIDSGFGPLDKKIIARYSYKNKSLNKFVPRFN